MEDSSKEMQKNKTLIPPTTSSSSALSSLMGMVHCNQVQERLREQQCADPENVDKNHTKQKHDVTSRCNEIRPDSLTDDDKDIKEFSTSPPSFKSANKHKAVVENNDNRSWSKIDTEDVKEDNADNDFHISSRKRRYPSTDKHKEPTTTESKFFRFSALAKELSGR